MFILSLLLIIFLTKLISVNYQLTDSPRENRHRKCLFQFLKTYKNIN